MYTGAALSFGLIRACRGGFVLYCSVLSDAGGSSAIFERSLLTEAGYLGPDSPRTSPRNETVKQCRRQMTVANSPVQWPSWTWCRKWWNHSWHSPRVTLNQCCSVFIRPRTPLVYRYHVISRTQSPSAVFGCSHQDECLEQHPPRVRILFDSWATSATIGRIQYVPCGRHRLRQKQSLDSAI